MIGTVLFYIAGVPFIVLAAFQVLAGNPGLAALNAFAAFFDFLAAGVLWP